MAYLTLWKAIGIHRSILLVWPKIRKTVWGKYDRTWEHNIKITSNTYGIHANMPSHIVSPRAAAGWARPSPPLWGLGQGPGPENVNKMWKWYEINVKTMRFCTLTWFSCVFQIVSIWFSRFLSPLIHICILVLFTRTEIQGFRLVLGGKLRD